MSRPVEVHYPMVDINFVARLNDTFIYKFTWRSNPNNIKVTAANVGTLPIIDVTGMTALMQVKNSPTDDSALISITDTNGIILDADNSPNISITIDQYMIASAGVGSYYYDLQLTDTVNTVTTIIGGTFTIEQDVSRPI